MADQTKASEKKEAVKEAPKKAAAPSHDHKLDLRLKSLKSHAASKTFNSGPHTEKHEDVLFDIKVLESLKRLNS